MLNIPRRYHRSSTSASNSPGSSPKSLDVLRALLDDLARDAAPNAPNDRNGGYPDTHALVKGLRNLALLIASPPAVPNQEAFRHAGGFQVVIAILRAYSGFYDPGKRSRPEMLALFRLLGAFLDVLAAAFRGHPGNKRYFRYRVAGGGWEALEQIIASIGLGGAESDSWASCHIFGKLLAFSLDDEALDLLCQSTAKALRPDPDPDPDPADPGTAESGDGRRRSQGPHEGARGGDGDGDGGDGGSDEQWDLVLARSVDNIGPSVREVVTAATTVRHPELLRVVVSFWRAIPRPLDAAPSPASIIVLETILCAASASIFNRAAIHSTGVLSQFLQVAFAAQPAQPALAPPEREKVLTICRLLMFLGVNQPADVQFLLSAQGSEAPDFFLEMTSLNTGPPFFQFDLSLHGHSSLELATLGRPFPPQSTGGYTFTAWIRVDKFDPTTHTTVFGVFDSTQTCFLLMYLERDTHNFILQTSVFSNKPSVRFKTVTFREKKWYHVAIVHRRPKTITTSKASLYINGEFAEQIRCNYPQMPPLANGMTETFASFNSNQNKTNPVQAFLGTPRDLSSRDGPDLVFSKWSLASAHLFEDVLSDDYLAVHYGLGPRYQGNFQDTLGGFQTYEASALLGLRNEIVHPGKDENSDILKAVRDKASSVLSESKILLSILPSATFPENVQYLDTGILRSLPRVSARNLFRLSSKEGAPLAINCAVPSLSDALFRVQGLASFRGTPIVVVPSYFDENLWRLAGFTPLALKLLEKADSVDETIRALEIMFHCIRRSWRNSDAMERDNGYSILGMLLRFKIGYGASPAPETPVPRLQLAPDEREALVFQTLSLVLGFVGYNHADPIESFIVNPLAYRILLIDLDIWRRSGSRVQELYYKQFVTFAVNSKHHDFNSRRLIRMRIVKRLLDAMKGEGVSEDVIPQFMSAFEALVRSNLSQEVMRSLSLFITYAFHVPALSISRTPRHAATLSRSSTPSISKLNAPEGSSGSSSPSPAAAAATRSMTKKQLGIRVLAMYSRILCEKGNLNHIKKFARTVTNKWLLYLLNEDDSESVLHGCKILARLLVAHGSAYTSKFAGKSGGFTVMANKLKRFWDVPALWTICFCILFGYDIADVDLDGDLDFATLLQRFEHRKVAYPDSLIIITSMLQHGLKDVMKYSDDPDSPATSLMPSQAQSRTGLTAETRARASSDVVARSSESRLTFSRDSDRVVSHAILLQRAIQLLRDLHTLSADFREFALTSEWTRLLLAALYPVVVSSDAVTPGVELNSRDSMLSFDGGDVMFRPMGGSMMPAPIVRTTSIDLVPSPQSTPPKGTPLRRASSFILLTTQRGTQDQRPSSFSGGQQPSPPRLRTINSGLGGSITDGIVDLIMIVFLEQVFVRKEFSGFGLSLKVPPGFQEHQAYFESYVLRKVTVEATSTIQHSQKDICEPRIITNLARLCVHLCEAIFEGWFINGAEAMIDFISMLLEFLQRPEIASLKSVRLCSQAISTIRSCLCRTILLKLSDLDSQQATEADARGFMNKLAYWQMSILTCFGPDDDYLKLFWYQLYTKLIDDKSPIRVAAANFLRIILVQKPDESLALIQSCMGPDQRKLVRDFNKLTEVDDETFVDWVDQHRPSLDVLFFGSMARTWEDFVSQENSRSAESAKSRLVKRKDKLKTWHAEATTTDRVILNHEIGNSAWMKSIYNAEHFRYYRIVQDQQDDLAFLTAAFRKMERDLKRPGAVFSEGVANKWKLDRTEGRNRMRLRLLPDYSPSEDNFKPKAKGGNGQGAPVRSVSSAATPALNAREASPNPRVSAQPAAGGLDGSSDPLALGAESEQAPDQQDSAFGAEDDFELVDDPNEPNEGDENFEDKNRKVMRRLQHGDQVQAAYNISRVTGLEPCEGILIVGKDALYIMDNVFQCASGDIVNVWQAPPEERDPFTQVVTGAKTLEKRQNAGDRDQESRSWRWQDVISISKRRFLFRDVAIEIFFIDGRSYLLTTINSTVRDDLFGKMSNKAPHTNAAQALPYPEDAWRLEMLKGFEESPQGLGSRLGTLFNASPWTAIQKKWQRGEVSNFHYLMMVNTMAGRTFNDLTQYPVFPWILADYTSEDLDLEDPATFRDLTKPMGSQTPNRVSGFIETFNALREIDQTPFHYGTHYSSAMIVSSYLIRLPPFVHSYLLVQGETFDHADRLFSSIADAWKSASCNNKTDVRELIPEFFCLPEFLTNINGYDFGRRQSNGAQVNNVELPPWAKGDPKIFIAKHREALESPHVTENLHHWIDLVFGYKQRGEAAVENLNVFHHLSYAGAIDLDQITDVNERAITAGVIHNFGQTPHQVFQKPHPPRDHLKSPIRRLDTAIFSLVCLPNPLLESHERVSSLVYAPKLDRLLCASPFRLNFPPFDKFMEWGYADSSIRFFFADNRKLAGLFENFHIGQISCASFADSKTLITAGEDCVVSVHAVVTSPGKPVELVPKSSLFGHKTPVTAMAVSKAFSTFVTASSDGQAFLWDLNQLFFIRKLQLVRPVECAQINNVTGEIMLCSGPNVVLYTLNGALVLEQNVCQESDDYVHSCAFYEGAGNEWLDNCLVFTGHRGGVVNVWRKCVAEGRWRLELLRRLEHVDYRSDKGENTMAGITCISAMPTCLYTGDDDGRVYEWNFSGRDR
ncbi:Beige protein -like protein 1 [Escovopsis weberi]|uniref:Beige protein homolog 1 n=1 Tax=Escovopsis weberi TaxID=150374 RepID=A0A0M8MZW4_ESCWE|nr:Beige protein -like protein 1 [Escovopsis weberi]